MKTFIVRSTVLLLFVPIALLTVFTGALIEATGVFIDTLAEELGVAERNVMERWDQA